MQFVAAALTYFFKAAGPRLQHSKPSKSSKQTWRSQRVRPASSRQPREDNKESRHPFALYGSGEKDADIAGRKTHNVRPAASTCEVIILHFTFYIAHLCLQSCIVTESKYQREMTAVFIFLVDPRVCSACQDQARAGAPDPDSKNRATESKVC